MILCNDNKYFFLQSVYQSWPVLWIISNWIDIFSSKSIIDIFDFLLGLVRLYSIYVKGFYV